ncbi:unnamed protein product [Symbiodinium natans]|uniref:alpha-mannosidase n=1 Tax=Symbiodinium natans TaxID=878477 RepID=A0A812J5U4_9DINO|nr:unnamed protein product [Symbiodinium natans]
MADATLKALRKKLGDIEDELDEATEAKAELEKQVNSLTAALEAARGDELQAALRDLQVRHESELQEAKSVQEKLEQALSSNADLEAKVAELQAGTTSPQADADGPLAEERQRAEKLQAEVQELSARNSALEEQLVLASVEPSMALRCLAIRPALSSNADLEAKVAELQAGTTSPQADADGPLAEERQRAEKLQAEVQELSARNSALEEQLVRHESELQEAKSVQEKLEQALSSNADLEAKVAELQAGTTSPQADADGPLAEERQRAEKLQAEVQELSARNSALEEQLVADAERQHSELRELREVLEQDRQKQQGLEAELEELRRRSSALGDLEGTVEKLRAEREVDGAERERLSRVCQELESDRDMALERMQAAERHAATQSSSLEEMQRAKASEAVRVDALAKEREAATGTQEVSVWGFLRLLQLRAGRGPEEYALGTSQKTRFLEEALFFTPQGMFCSAYGLHMAVRLGSESSAGKCFKMLTASTCVSWIASLPFMLRMPIPWTLLGAWQALAVLAEPAVEVHIVAHTHDDVGWLKTVDEYYTGQNNSIQHAYVHMILDTVVRCLEQNPNRTFTYVEQAFFVRWWRQQDDATRALVKRLVSSGQLEFTNGGWCMHDEAAPHFLDMIDQTTLGHKFLMDEFGVAPRTGWQLDPFGHSATQAALLSAEVGFQGLFFGRIDYQDIALRREKKEAEFVWRASPSLGSLAQVFTGLTGEYGGNYGPPSGFDWDVGNSDETIQDDPALEDYNVKSRVEDFVKAAMDQANETRGRHIMMTMGSDFQYEDAFTWFYNLDKLIQHVNADGRVHVFYSTPGRYVDAKKSEQITWPLKEDDFFPYADGPHQFWTGYFTSRPALKRYIRDTSAFFQVAKQISAIAGPTSEDGIEKLAEAMGVAQHHDAVSGTAKQHVTFDYAKRLAKGRAAAMPGISAALGRLTQASEASPELFFCDLRNVSVCAPTQAVGKTSQRTCFTLWNGLGQEREELIELPVSSDKVEVVPGSGNEAVQFQLVESLPSVTNYGAPAGGAAQTLLVAIKLPAMGHASYCLQTAGVAAPKATLANISQGSCQALENENLKLWFCGGMMANITDKLSKTSTRAEQSWMWYNASLGNAASSQASGAYIFRPNRSEAFPVFTGLPFMRVFRGPLADEVHQAVGSWISQRTRLARGARHVEITYTVSDIPVDDGWGKEIVSRISTDIKNDGTCYTDSNGREMLQRKRDFRPTWKLNQTEPVAGNYYPVTTSLFIRDQAAQLTVLTDVSEAGTGCVRDGEIELMVHRRLLKDDGRGVGEPLNETEFVTPYLGNDQGRHYGPGLVVRGQHWLHFAPPATAARGWRPLMDRLYLPVQPFFGKGAATGPFSALPGSLPPSLQVITLAPWDDTHILLRIGHQFGIGEDSELSKPVSVDIKSLLIGAKVVSIEERGLAATITKDEVEKRRIAWQVEGPTAASPAPPQSEFSFGPLQIRTFFVQIVEALRRKSGQVPRPELSSLGARAAWGKERPTGAQRWDIVPHYCQVVQGRRAEHGGRGWLQVTTRMAAEETWTLKGRSEHAPRVREHFVVFELPREASGVAEDFRIAAVKPGVPAEST